MEPIDYRRMSFGRKVLGLVGYWLKVSFQALVLGLILYGMLLVWVAFSPA